MSPLLLIGSLVAVLGLVAVAWALGLGGGGIADEEEARRIAEEALPGFAAGPAFVSADGRGAFVLGEGELALLKQHGVAPAVRRLALPVAAEPLDGGVAIRSGDRMFGAVVLALPPEARDKLLTLL